MTRRNRCLVQADTVTREIPTPAGGVVIETFVPWKVVRRGVRKRIVTPLGEPEAFAGEASSDAGAENSPLLRALDGGKAAVRSRRVDGRPVAGTRLMREWNGNTHEVVVGIDYYEYQGRRYASLSSVAKVITGTNWNGWRFFGFMSARGLS